MAISVAHGPQTIQQRLAFNWWLSTTFWPVYKSFSIQLVFRIGLTRYGLQSRLCVTTHRFLAIYSYTRQHWLLMWAVDEHAWHVPNTLVDINSLSPQQNYLISSVIYIYIYLRDLYVSSLINLQYNWFYLTIRDTFNSHCAKWKHEWLVQWRFTHSPNKF